MEKENLDKILNFAKDNWFRVGVIMVFFIGMIGYFEHLGTEKAIAEQQRIDRIQQEQREYVASRKKDCYAIYEGEKEKWGNTQRPEYDEDADVCRVIYESKKGEWDDVDCDDWIPDQEITVQSIRDYSWRQYSLCSAGEFEREF